MSKSVLFLLIFAITPLILIPIGWNGGYGIFTNLLLIWSLLLTPICIIAAGVRSHSIEGHSRIRRITMIATVVSAAIWLVYIILILTALMNVIT